MLQSWGDLNFILFEVRVRPHRRFYLAENSRKRCFRIAYNGIDLVILVFNDAAVLFKYILETNIVGNYLFHRSQIHPTSSFEFSVVLVEK